MGSGLAEDLCKSGLGWVGVEFRVVEGWVSVVQDRFRVRLRPVSRWA